ncbi:Inhibitor of nuclear factor kappa-B kinase subunit alpha [Oopsacas minuta]|uniref:Inhibitor of nuclear factor kappa-B kinase subunit alpha n=1 Tax=Oopsacas minuta TaxID=111878 RepID=A0AAV7K1D2_9METZ|nr:Inhibitor of nuclear factor kappa-B kinase subunit alpha [Oopsacas minuta]
MANNFGFYDAVVPTWENPIQIGDGPYGYVVRFTPRDSSATPIAAKVFHANNASSDYSVECHYEKKLLQQLNHPNIVKCILGPPDLVKLYPKSSLMFMEYCDLGNLRNLLEESSNAFGAHQSVVMNFLNHISNGINYLHSKQIIHRNIKPENILLQHKTPNEVIYKLGDFGYARQFSITSIFKSFIGTFQYLSPEVLSNVNQEKLSGKIVLPNSTVDLWAFGVTAFEVITGSRPFMIDLVGPEWAKHIENKQNNVIHIYIGETKQLVCSTIIPQPHRLSCILSEHLTTWLRLLLDCNAETRGGRDPRTQNKSVWYSMLESILSTRVINFVMLHQWVINPIQFSQEDSLVSILDLFSTNFGNPNSFLLLREDGKTINQLGADETLCRYHNEGYLFIFPFLTKGMPKILEFFLSMEIQQILRDGFNSTNKRKVVLQIKQVISLILQILSEYETFFRGALAVTNYLKLSIEKLKVYLKKIAFLSASLSAKDIFIPNSTIDSTLSKLQGMSLMPQYRNMIDKVSSITQKWEELKQICLTTMPEVKAIEDLCQDAEQQISKVENILEQYPCQVYLSELESRRIAIQSLTGITIEMIEKVGYTNGVRINNIIDEEIKFLKEKPLQLNSLISSICSLPNILMSYEVELNRACTLMNQDFISGISKNSTGAIEELAFLIESTLNISEFKDHDKTW